MYNYVLILFKEKIVRSILHTAKYNLNKGDVDWADLTGPT